MPNNTNQKPKFVCQLEKVYELLKGFEAPKGYDIVIPKNFNSYTLLPERALIFGFLHELMCFSVIPFKYLKSKEQVIQEAIMLFGSLEIIDVIDQNFYQITATGNELTGCIAFYDWCKNPKRNYDITTRARQYYEEYKKYQSYKNKYGLIDASKKLFDPKTHSNLDKTYSNLDGLFYCEFYTIGNFGKTRLGNEVFYGKQGPNPELIKNAIKTVKTTIKNYAEQFDAVGFVAPTNDRPIQFMVELEKSLELDLPKINILKVKTPIKVAQKTLKDKSERQENAKATFEVHSDQPYQKVLLIDDLTGSGSTLNELANKIKAQNISDYVVGLTLVGSENGITNTSQKFETISEA